ncbi:MAG: YfiR family protein [Alphaproteobacteria bacterium]|nr:YfiR family protein [Alphaproteobacteria bacterium]MBU0859190.1 YfiR family protein [Alphaproteobacteria bacterium]
MGILRNLMMGVIICAAVAMVPAVPKVRAQDNNLRLNEQKIKAGLIYNFLKATQWPKNPLMTEGGTLNICLLGGDSFAGYLHPLQGRTAQKYTIEIKILRSLADADFCHFLFVHDNQAGHLENIIAELQDKPVLTASSIPNFSRRGGMLEFGMKSGRVHLYMNRDRVAQSDLIIEEKIARLTEPVHP